MDYDIDDATDDFLEHFGVKGMKWGHRSQAKLDRLNRVAEGKGSFIDQYAVATRASLPGLVKGHGVKGYAANQAAKRQASKERIESGHAKARDVLRKVGEISLLDIAYGDRPGGNQELKKKIGKVSTLLDLTN